MRFVLVHAIESPESEDRSILASQRWHAFRDRADINGLTKITGVFQLDRNTWIFDLEKSLPKFSQVLHESQLQNIQLFVLRLRDENAFWYAHLYEKGGIEQLEKFLDPLM